eukprot:TRINITY_DN4560_c0_g1_i6.p1 TRINITY_DN4560_c0_g1~~TRINITY_DN4560_c0_g1_i6.p1  ORF type:complete len:327 (-),score=36.37 TRINITY_DN4560_c0_g1_i6:103-954(-)
MQPNIRYPEEKKQTKTREQLTENVTLPTQCCQYCHQPLEEKSYVKENQEKIQQQQNRVINEDNNNNNNNNNKSKYDQQEYLTPNQLQDTPAIQSQILLSQQLDQMKACLDEIRNQQVRVENELKNFIQTTQETVEKLSNKIEEAKSEQDNQIENLRKQVNQSKAEDGHFGEDSSQNYFRKEHQQLRDQLDQLRFDLDNKENYMNHQACDKKYGWQNECQMRNWGAVYPHGTNLPLGPVYLNSNYDDNQQQFDSKMNFSSMQDYVPLGKAFARDYSSDKKCKFG